MPKNTNADELLDCYSCGHSQSAMHPYKGELLVCSLTMGLATTRCPKFSYEPGTDAKEKLS